MLLLAPYTFVDERTERLKLDPIRFVAIAY
jgi:hypothetical protein